MNKKVLIIIMGGVIILSSIVFSKEYTIQYNDFLTRSIADNIYCLIDSSNCDVTPRKWKVNDTVIGTLDDNGTLRIAGDLKTNDALGNPGLLYELYVDDVLMGEFNGSGVLFLKDDIITDKILNEKGIIVRYHVDNNFQGKVNQTGTFFILNSIITNVEGLS